MKPRYLLTTLLCFSAAAPAQSTCMPKVDFAADGSVQVTDCAGKKHTSQLPAAGGPSAPTTSEPAADYPAAKAAYDNYLKAFYEYNTNALENRREVFSWQYVSTIVIFVVVVLLVFAGVVFAALQLKHGLRRKAQNVDTVEVSLGSVKVSSSTMGVIILTLSMCFFYLYLKYVYPVSIVTDSSTPPSATAPGR